MGYSAFLGASGFFFLGAKGDGFFLDRTTAAKLGKPSLAYLAWGTAFFDWDLDGDEDLFVANGHMDDNVELFEESTYAQRNQLFRNDGAVGFSVDVGGALIRTYGEGLRRLEKA